MPIVLHGRGKEVCLTESQTEPRERLHYGVPHCFVPSTSQTRKVILESSPKTSDVKVFSFKVSLGHFIFIFSLEVTKQNGETSAWDQILVPFLPLLPNSSQNGSCAPYVECDQLFTLLPPWKKKKKMMCFFATDLAIWNSSHYPFLGLKLLSLKVPSHRALYQLVLEKSWIAYVQNCLNFILFWNCFFGVGAHWPPHLAVRALRTVCGLAVCWSVKVFFPTQHPFLVRFR